MKKVGRPVVFSESAPAYFQGTPGWYDVLNWVGGYGQLWREGTDINVFDAKKPDASRFDSILWNYAYIYLLVAGRNRATGMMQTSSLGDRGTNLASRTQLALWAMMSAPLILSSDLEKLDSRRLPSSAMKPFSPSIRIPLGNQPH